MIINVITMYPDMFPGPLGSSVVGRALKNGLWQINVVDIKEFGKGAYRKVDDVVFGGGPGLLIKPDVASDAIEFCIKEFGNYPLVHLSPCGEVFNHSLASRLSNEKGLNIFCSHFEGLDYRVIEHYNMHEISIGDYILTGGELASFILIDSCVRLVAGVVGNDNSVSQESFSNGLLECQQYTRPRIWKGREVPKELLSGNHGAIEKWRGCNSLERTGRVRPDLLNKK